MAPLSMPAFQPSQKAPEQVIRRAVQKNLLASRVGMLKGGMKIGDEMTVTMWHREDTDLSRDYLIIDTLRGIEAQRQFERRKGKKGFGYKVHGPDETAWDIDAFRNRLRRRG